MKRSKGATRSVQAGEERAAIMAVVTNHGGGASRAQLLEALAKSRLAHKFPNGATRLDSVLNNMKRSGMLVRRDDGMYRPGKNAAPAVRLGSGNRDVIAIETRVFLTIGNLKRAITIAKLRELRDQLDAYLTNHEKDAT